MKRIKKPEEIQYVKPLKKLSEIHDMITIYFVDRVVGTVSALEIEEYFPINEEMGGVVKGQLKLGGYNNKDKCFYSMGNYPVTRWPPNQIFLTWERINEDESYIQDHLKMKCP